MKQYIITIIGAAILSALAEIISPEKWRGYIKIITGLIIISCIISPFMSLVKFEGFQSFNEEICSTAEMENLQQDIVLEELKSRIDRDIEERLEKEFGIKTSADCYLKVGDDGVFEGVGEIYLSGHISSDAKSRLSEVYGVELRGVHDE